tara:strand:+ start:945 stop:1403 length:459 start_codon:yes stop_codon:yes gene_type:complete
MTNNKSSIKISYLVGLPFGLVLGLTVWFLFVTADGSLFNFISNAMGYSVVSLVVGFVFSIWKAGITAENSLRKEKSLIFTSFKFCLIVNGIMWGSFALTQIIMDLGLTVLLQVPIIGFILCLPFTTFTIGLLISYLIRNNINQTTHNTTYST